MAKLWDCACGALNRPGDAACEACGDARPPRTGDTPSTSPSRRTVCDCGARLFASGLCSATGGYPATSSCPLACPICRGMLDWDGGCQRCYGCTTGKREDWTFPGDRYELDKGHWQRVDGPRAAATSVQNAAGFAAIRVLLERMGGPIPVGTCARHPEGCGRSQPALRGPA